MASDPAPDGRVSPTLMESRGVDNVHSRLGAMSLSLLLIASF
jgi:hypothetical protein